MFSEMKTQPDTADAVAARRLPGVIDSVLAVPGTARSIVPLRAMQIGMDAAESSGGATRYYFNLMRALPACFVTGPGLVFGDPALLGENNVVKSFAADGSSLLARWSALRRNVAAELPNCDLVVSHFAPYVFPVLDTIRKRPMIVHFHGAWALEGAYEGAGKVSVAVKHALERVVYSRGSRFIVLSEASGAILEHEYGVPHEAVRVIPGGVEMHKFRDTLSRSEAREVLGWPADRPTIVTVRRLARTKGLGNLIDAIDAVRRAVPDVLLMIAGTGPLEHELAEQVRDLGLARWVRFIGHVGADLPTVYRAADISVVPSLALEGFGLVVIESLACGTPALVTPVTGLPEVVADLDPALVFPSVDKTDIARGLIDALTGRVPLPSSANCVVHAERFDWPVIAQRIAAVYLEAAQQAS